MYNKNSSRPNRISFYVFNFWGGEGIGSYYQNDAHPITAGDWIHVVGAADSQKTYLFINGGSKKEDYYDENSPFKDRDGSQLIIYPKRGTAPIRVGTREKKAYFQGDISD